MSLDLDAIRKRVQSLPHSECKWKREGWVVLDIRDRPVLESLSYLGRDEVADFCVNAPEDIGLLLHEVERLQRVIELLLAANHISPEIVEQAGEIAEW